jgi:hypothetical protein
MTTISLAKEKWARKMRDAGAKWKKGVAGKETAYREGLGTFSQGAVGSTMPAHWLEGVGAVTPEEFAKAVAGKEGKWASKLAEAIAS